MLEINYLNVIFKPIAGCQCRNCLLCSLLCLKDSYTKVTVFFLSFFRFQLYYQVLNFGMIVSSALMIWKGLMVVTGSESPIVVVLRYVCHMCLGILVLNVASLASPGENQCCVGSAEDPCILT